MKRITLLSALFLVTIIGGRTMAQTDFSKGSNYYLIYLDNETASTIPAGKIAKDYRVDDTNHFLYIWDGTYNSLLPSGPNSNGEMGEFLNFEVASGQTWSGFGFASVAASPKDMTGITADYTLHFAMKSSNSASHAVKLEGPGGLAAFAVVGSTPFSDAGVTYQPVTDFPRDNKWHSIEIPMKHFFDQGLRYPEPMVANAFAMLSGGVGGVTISLDAIYFYSKSGVGIHNEQANNLQVMVGKEVITLVGATAPVELFTLTGAKIASSEEPVIGIEGIGKGIYLIRSGAFTQKVVLR